MSVADPFFLARDRFNATNGPVKNYIEDLARTYGNPFNGGRPLPSRQTDSYKAALAYRQQELDTHRQTTTAAEELRDQTEALRAQNATLGQELQDARVKLSELMSANVPNSDRGGDLGGGGGGSVLPAVPPEPEVGRVKAVTFSGDEVEETVDDVPADDGGDGGGGGVPEEQGPREEGGGSEP